LHEALAKHRHCSLIKKKALQTKSYLEFTSIPPFTKLLEQR